MLSLYGHDHGNRIARKHLGWALDAAAATTGAPNGLLKLQRVRVLTAEDPALVRSHLAEAFDRREADLLYFVLASSATLGEAMARAERSSTITNGL